MKKATGQSNSYYSGQTTYVLDNLNEAIALVLHSDLYKGKQPDSLQRLILEQTKDVVKKAKEVNPDLRFDLKSFSHSWHYTEFSSCIKDIYTGNIPEWPNIVQEAKSLAAKLKDIVLDIEPSLKLDQTWQQTEQSDVWDAGAIARGDDRPCFAKSKEDQHTKPGKGDGAYRIVINTDVHWAGNPMFQGAALCALVDILQGQAPVEIWIQQGWLGLGAENGCTLFPIHRGGVFDLSRVTFWIAHPYKDSCFSRMVNRVLGRTDSYTSKEVELPCDLYIYGLLMPEVKKDIQAAAEWVKATARKMLFDEEDPTNWEGEK